MPMVTESRSSDRRLLPCRTYQNVDYWADVQIGEDATQFGYRSGDDPDPYRAGDNRRDRRNYDVLRLISEYDREYLTRGNRSSQVNHRDYERIRSDARHFSWNVHVENVRHEMGIYAYAARAVAPYGNGFTPQWSDIVARANDLKLTSLPAAPQIDLIRSIGEMRDLPLMLRKSNYVPRNIREGAGGYLNYVFGVKPTVSDIQGLVENIHNSDSIIRNFTEHAARQVRRSRTYVFREETVSGTLRPSAGSKSLTQSVRLGTTQLGTISSYCVPTARSIAAPTGASVPMLSYNYAVTATSKVKYFAVYEYFIPRPLGFMDRLDLYRMKAEQVLGQGLSPAAIYDLTPWSWLVDWFVDIGGLLRYQQVVADYNIVCSKGGFVFETKTSMELVPRVREPRGSDLRHYWTDLHTAPRLTVVGKTQQRRKSGAYYLDPSIELNGSQLAILAALGLSRDTGWE